MRPVPPTAKHCYICLHEGAALFLQLFLDAAWDDDAALPPLLVLLGEHLVGMAQQEEHRDADGGHLVVALEASYGEREEYGGKDLHDHSIPPEHS